MAPSKCSTIKCSPTSHPPTVHAVVVGLGGDPVVARRGGQLPCELANLRCKAGMDGQRSRTVQHNSMCQGGSPPCSRTGERERQHLSVTVGSWC